MTVYTYNLSGLTRMYIPHLRHSKVNINFSDNKRAIPVPRKMYVLFTDSFYYTFFRLKGGQLITLTSRVILNNI